jgi:hypothetical protein
VQLVPAVAPPCKEDAWAACFAQERCVLFARSVPLRLCQGVVNDDACWNSITYREGKDRGRTKKRPVGWLGQQMPNRANDLAVRFARRWLAAPNTGGGQIEQKPESFLTRADDLRAVRAESSEKSSVPFWNLPAGFLLSAAAERRLRGWEGALRIASQAGRQPTVA